MHNHQRFKTAKRATIVNASTNFMLSVLKVVLGIFGNSHALLADGIHSFSDLFTDALVYFTAKISSQSPDKEHPYGHRRVETVSTIIIALLLAGIAIGIGIDAFNHIFSNTIEKNPSIVVVVIAVISVISNEFLYHYTLYEGNKINSDLLRSNAWHNRSDALVSLVVLVSVIGAILGANYLDSIGALLIAVLILSMSIKMIWKSIKELIDTGIEEQLIQKISKYIMNIPGVISLHQLRTRSHGGHIILDMHIQVSPTISISEGHYISEQVIILLKQEFSQVIDVTVHIDPENDEEFNLSKHLPSRKMMETVFQSHCHRIPSYPSIKKIDLHYLNGKIIAELYLPLSAYQKQLENTYQQAIKEIPYIQEVKIYYF